MLREKPDLNALLRDVPHQPGVYLMHDRLNRIIYVGKAKDLRKRLSNYFQPARSRLVDLKTRALIRSIWNFEYHTVRNEPESLLLEQKLIKEYRPKYNVSFRDDKRFLLLKIHPDEPWPRFHLTRMRKDDGARYFGPFAHSGSLRATLGWMQRQFGLRACRPLEPNENDYRHCNNDIIRNCSAPCMGRITRTEYLQRVQEACNFLDGKAREHLKEIEAEMLKAAEDLDFERAADLRDMLIDFKKTVTPVRRFTRRRGVPGAAINPMEDVKELGEVLQLNGPPLVMECFDISNISSNHIVASMVRFRDGMPDSGNYRRYRIRTVKGQNDFASMSEVVRRRYSRILLEGRSRLGEDADFSQEDPLEAMRRLEREQQEASPAPFVRLPDLVIVDGGKGQLSSAYGEIQRLGLHHLPIIGLAKEREEVFFPDKTDPLVMPHTMGALRLLQRIRDEAHRWANGYHQLLMKRRVEESVLDDIPGISENRKAALLKEFGSVARLRKQTPEALARVSGISKRLAGAVLEWLETH
ncbi:MAG TPA: excinuclease ABC subunit UvrC [Verrucomicrobiales bacterium]|nr:excinuclease ABC subunit UvrC [Verrucomicrobiales bacterium]